MSLLDDVKHALTLRKVLGRLKEERMKGKVLTALYGLVGAIVTAIVAQVTGACPGLLSHGIEIACAGVGGGLALLVEKRKAHQAAGIAVAAGLILTAIKAKLDVVCPGLWSSLPTIATASLWVGVAAWLESSRAPKA